ncbi:MAG: NAD-dependent deacylase [Planctomycetes bacterium]|nr:NAD-dependent deacylase [Planctomycetota bacterium]
MTGSRSALVVLTGAGVSADSGVATFRGGGGLWEGHHVEDVATPLAWARDPKLVWRFYQLRRRALGNVEPNAAHRALAELERELSLGGIPFTLVTQNVDDLHERAGSSPLHMHGELVQLRCERCGAIVRELEHLAPDAFLPCASCGHARVRPDIVWFGEMPYFMDRIERALCTCTHFVSIGTSGVVYPAAGFLSLARQAGARTYVNSLEAPDNLEPRDTFRAGRAIDVVPALSAELLGELLGES